MKTARCSRPNNFASFLSKQRFLAVCILIIAVSLCSACSSAKNSDLDTVLLKAKNEKRVVMLELGSVGCVPCDMMQPVMFRLSQEYKDRFDVYFVDVKDYPLVARRFGVYGIPTQVFLDAEGKEFHRHVGFYEYAEIATMLSKAGI